MSTTSEIQTTRDYLSASYDVVEELGGTIPEHKNMANLASAIDSIPTAPEGLATTLYALRAQLKAGTAIKESPVGTEIPDTWNGISNPLIVGHYSTIQTADGQLKPCVGLLRKFVDPTDNIFGGSANYPNSDIYNYLQTTYLNLCSGDVKNNIASVKIPYLQNANALMEVESKWFIFSNTEVLCQTKNRIAEGEAWDIWKQRMGISQPTDLTVSNAGRIVKNTSGRNAWWWTRSYHSNNTVFRTDTGGTIHGDGALITYNSGILAGFYMVAN